MLTAGLPLRIGKSTNHKSLIERGSVRLTLLPQAVAKKELSFSTTGYYDENTNIHAIHKYVADYFQTLAKDIPTITDKIAKLNQRLQTERLQMIDIKVINNEIARCEKERQALGSGEKYKEYLERATPVLDEYIKYQTSEGPYFKFGEERRFSPDKLSLVRSFIQIASDYTPLNLTLRPFNCSGLCPYCRQQLADDEDGKIICYECDIYQDALTHDAEFSDLTRINSANNNGYMNRDTYERAKRCYQGKQPAEFPPELFTRFDEYCTFNHKNRVTLTYETTRPIFKQIGYPGFYEDINLFLFMHTDIRKPLPDISEHEALIDQDYEKFYQKYIEVKGDERDSALNAWYLLYILLRRRNIPCNKCDFKMPETPSIRISNDNIARRVFQALNWKFEDTV